MKRYKRDRYERAEKQGYMAGIKRRSKEICPYQEMTKRERWLNGWRKAREHIQLGIIH
ncbi:MAG: ribosome modulation factor [Gammaproteobacteria bacterium]|nr:MAG: ribosome modulation factor [Gammaproteobacteria bacterium]